MDITKSKTYKKYGKINNSFHRTDLIIQKDNIEGDFEKGDLNPFKTPHLTQYVNIDTRFRPNLYSTIVSNFTFTLPAPIKKVVSLKLASYELPICFYGISKSYGNNFLNINVKYEFQSRIITSKKIIVVKDGNYSALDLISALNNLLAPVDSLTGLLLNNSPNLESGSIFNEIGFNLDVTTNGSGSGKIILKSLNSILNVISIGMDFTLDVNGIPDNIPVTSKLGFNLGFIYPSYSGSNMYISDTIPDSAAMRYIYLAINDFNNSASNTYISAFSNWGNNNILARIPINGPFFNVLMDNDLSQHLEPRQYFGPVDIQKIQIQILDDHGRILNMNKSNFTIVLAFKTLYD